MKYLIHEEELQPIQTISNTVEDIIHYEETISLHEAVGILEKIYIAPMDIVDCPLIHLHVIKTFNEGYAVLVKLHHIIFDEWASLYQSIIQKKTDPLPPLAFQYIDYAFWQKKNKDESVINYWRKKLHDAPTLIDMPYDFPLPAVLSQRGNIMHFDLSPVLMDKLINKAQSMGITLYVLGLSALYIQLYKCTGKKDFCLGSPYANR